MLTLYLIIYKISEKRSCFRNSQTSNVFGDVISHITTFVLILIFIHYILIQTFKGLLIKRSGNKHLLQYSSSPYPWGTHAMTPMDA